MSGSVTPWLIYSTATFAVGLGVRVWTGYQSNIRRKREAAEPIADPFALEVAFAPRKTDAKGDEAVLDEMKAIVAQANRKSRALEFETIDHRLAAYYDSLAEAARAPARRAVVRLIESNDRRLQLIGARTASNAHIVEAAASLRQLIDSLPSAEDAESHELSDLAWALTAIAGPE